MRLLISALAVSAVSFAAVTVSAAETNPVSHAPTALPQSDVHQVIVKLRGMTSAGAAASGQAHVLSAHDQLSAVAGRVGLTMEESRPITDKMHVLRVRPVSAGETIAMTVARLQADSDVEYAEPDQRRYPHAVPNDPLYPATLNPNNPGQWYLQANTAAVPAAVNFTAAWDITTGDPNLVIADIDTGVRYDHPDLLTLAANGRLLPGYDFITDVNVANDGDGRDADASDPGDWITSSDTATSQFKSCKVGNSSWHGTRTAGVLGALTNNATGVAGTTWQGKILPVRALGKCGGQDSDIVTAMLWAAGIHVTNAPDNPNPARIINMSLGATGSCGKSYSDAISQVTARGVLVVVSAGNENGPVDSPANCPGVAAVAGIRNVGTKVGYSSFGAEVALSAPAGNCINSVLSASSPCVYPITSTTNPGTTTPSTTYTATNAYTDQLNNANLGTSFSAPIVAGIGALMAAVNGNLNSCQLISRLKEGSLPFPQTSAGESAQPPMCPATAPNSQECICTLDGKTCGAGMANAQGAVAAALRPIAAVSLPASVSAGQSVALNAQGSSAAVGHSISSYQWTSVGAQSVSIQNGTTATPSLTAPSCGYATVQLTVTDDAGRQDTTSVVLSPTSATSSAPTSATVRSCTATTSPVLLAVCPGTSNVQAGSGTQTFTATVANTTNTDVTWEVNGVAGGNATSGTISSTGVYTAPATVPSPATVSVQAVSSADQTVVSSTQVTITSPPSSGGGGAMDGVSLLVELLACGVGLAARSYKRRCAVSSQVF